MSDRKYLPTFAELLDRMTICQLKAIFIPENKEAYDQEFSERGKVFSITHTLL